VEVSLARTIRLVRQAITTLSWLLAVIAISFGAAGVVAGLDAPATNGGDRTGRTARGDEAVIAALAPIEADLHVLADDVHALSGNARGVLAALAANDVALAESASATGTPLVKKIDDEAGAIRDALRSVPVAGSGDAAYLLSPATRERYANDVDAISATDGLSGHWARLTIGSLSARSLSSLLANHDRAVVAAAARGRAADYAGGLGHLDDADDAIAQARLMRDKLAASVDVSTLDAWLDRSGVYDKALRDLYAALRASGGVVNDAVRKAARAEEAAKARLPPDTRALVLIMSDIGRGGMTDSADAIDQAAADIDEALAPVELPSP
jgi:hypothetical protein